MNNLLSYRGLVDARIRASNKDLPDYGFKGECGTRTLLTNIVGGTGKSFSEALILASTNPRYDKRFLMVIP